MADDTAQTDNSASLSPTDKQAEIDGVKAAEARFKAVKSFADMGPCLTNRSAGFMAIMVGGMTVSFLGGLDSIKTDSNGMPIVPKKPLENAAETKFDAILAKYGLDAKSETTPGAEAILKLHGRELFADVAKLMATLPNKDGGQFKPSKDIPTDETYHVVSPTQVDVGSARDPKQKVTVILEDGLWRMDMGDMFADSGASSSDSDDSSDAPAEVVRSGKTDPPIFNALLADDTQKVEALYNADHSVVSEKNAIGAEPLGYVAFFPFTDMISLLISEGADVNAQDHFGMTALIQAVMGNQVESVRMLLKHGARTAYKDNNGETALSFARKNHDTEIVRLLTAAGATR
jgi:hypothetical protein